PFIGIAFAAMGWYMPKIHQNYFAGFKLPWTLENVDNWNETHKVAGTVWVLGGVFQAIATIALSSKLGFICFMIAIVLMVSIPTAFSYRMFKRGNTIQ
ncbi:MAG: SdpI family protein, partial [Sediminibacterium sp.]